jgi:hypothetical protein
MQLFRFERINQPVATLRDFLYRLARSLLAVVMLAGVSLLVGIIGYHYLEGRTCFESFEDAATIMSGKGTLHHTDTVWGKVFASLYALYSGIALGIILAPIGHRVLHHFLHVPDKDA